MPEFLLASEYSKFGTVPALRPSRPLSTGPILFCAPGPIPWQARQMLNTVFPFCASCAKAGTDETTIKAAAAIDFFIMVFPRCMSALCQKPTFAFQHLLRRVLPNYGRKMGLSNRRTCQGVGRDTQRDWYSPTQKR